MTSAEGPVHPPSGGPATNIPAEMRPIRWLSLASDELEPSDHVGVALLSALIRCSDNRTRRVVAWDGDRMSPIPMKVLAAKARLHDRTARESLAKLKAAGWVHVQRRDKPGSKEQLPSLITLMIPPALLDEGVMATDHDPMSHDPEVLATDQEGVMAHGPEVMSQDPSISTQGSTDLSTQGSTPDPPAAASPLPGGDAGTDLAKEDHEPAPPPPRCPVEIPMPVSQTFALASPPVENEPKRRSRKKPRQTSDAAPVREAYVVCYRAVVGRDPIMAAAEAKAFRTLVDRMGATEAEQIIRDVFASEPVRRRFGTILKIARDPSEVQSALHDQRRSSPAVEPRIEEARRVMAENPDHPVAKTLGGPTGREPSARQIDFLINNPTAGRTQALGNTLQPDAHKLGHDEAFEGHKW